MFRFDALVYMALLAVVVVIGVAAHVVRSTPETPNLEARKIRFAAATFTGILMLIIFSSVLYFVDATGPGRDIFEKTFTGLSPIAGGIIGYLFAVRVESGSSVG